MSLIIYMMMFTGYSMMPTLEPGIHNVTIADNIETGNVYCYNYDHRNFPNINTRYVCHRLIAICDDYCFFKGDNNIE